MPLQVAPQAQAPQAGAQDPMTAIIQRANALTQAGVPDDQVKQYITQQAQQSGVQMTPMGQPAPQQPSPQAAPQSDPSGGMGIPSAAPVALQGQLGVSGPKVAREAAPSGYRFTKDGQSLEPIPGGPADSSGSGQGLDPAAIENAAWTFAATGKLPPIGRGREGVAQRTAIMNQTAKLATALGVSPAELQTVPGRNKAFQSSLTNLQKMSDVMEKSELGFQNNTNIALRLSSQVDRTGSPVVNKWLLGGKKALGDPQVEALDAAITTMSVDYARIMSGQTGASGTPISTAEEAKSMIRKELSDKSFNAVVDVLNQDIVGQQAAVHAQRGKILGAMQMMHDDAAPGGAQAAQGQSPSAGSASDADPLGLLK